MAKLLEHIVGLSPEKLTALQGAFKERAGERQAIPVIENRHEAPLSFAQERLWFLDQMAPGSAAYNMAGALRLTGTLDVTALNRSLSEILRRHEVLRTTIAIVNGEPVAVTAPAEPFTLSVTELRGAPQNECETQIQKLIAEETQRSFDLTRGPLFRARLLWLGEADHIFLYTMHHIVSDGWSIGVLYRELGALYNAFRTGAPSTLSELPIQYADFAAWQRQWLQEEFVEAQLSYWKPRLEAVSPLQLSIGGRKRAVRTSRGAENRLALSKGLSESLKALSRQERATLFMTLLAAFKILLCRYTGQEDIVVGVPIANRTRPETRGLIGFFVNSLILRTDLSGNPSFREVLARVREVCLGAYSHQELPFEKLIERLRPERDVDQTPLFQVMFALQNAPMSLPDLSGVAVTPLTVNTRNTRNDLEAHLWDRAEGITSALVYRADLFEDAVIAAMQRHFQTLLEGVVTNPDRRLSEMPLLGNPERHRLLVEWNATRTDSSSDRCIHELVEAQAERTPDAVAVAFEEAELTYEELNRRANEVAHYLGKVGVGPETLIGICVERSLEMVVGLLGVLKSGGAYVPLDPNYPLERLAFMLDDSRPLVVLTQQKLLSLLPEMIRHPRSEIRDEPYAKRHQTVICLDRDREAIARESGENPVSGVMADNLAYLIFTSGSTGQPKAVAMSHGSLCNLLTWQLRNIRDPVPAKTLQFAPLSFDVSFQEIFTTLCSGGTLLLIREELRRDPVAFLRQLTAHSVERLFVPFVALRQLAEAADDGTAVPAKLREVIAAGEALHITPRITNWFRKLEGCHLYNQYGPSESHVVTAFTLTDSAIEWPALPPIGRPIANTEIYILDRHLHPVPIGVPGQIYIVGAGLARGYFNRPGLSAEKFIPNPFSNEPGARMYETGDLARYLPDGNIEFLGRMDHQVKIRGFRVELGEIEAVLRQYPGVRETVVLAREDTPGEKRHVAYVVPNPDRSPSIGELRRILKEKLPEYMIPSDFVIVDTLPLTPNGKVDRRALPAPDLRRPELESSFVAPRTPVEEALAKIWAEVLRLKTAGVHDNFFDLGGHSLLATQVISRVRAVLKVELPLRNLFEAPTVAGLAERIETVLWAAKSREGTSGEREKRSDRDKKNRCKGGNHGLGTERRHHDL